MQITIGIFFCICNTNLWIFTFPPQKFEEGILEICFHLLRRANGNTVHGAKMSDPIQISRTISKIVSTATV